MYKIKLNNGEKVSIEFKKGDKHFSVPFDENNSDYQAYLEWVKLGNVAAEEEIFANQSDKEKRQKELPSFQDQLEMIYELGVEGWKEKIKPIMEKYPKKP